MRSSEIRSFSLSLRGRRFYFCPCMRNKAQEWALEGCQPRLFRFCFICNKIQLRCCRQKLLSVANFAPAMFFNFGLDVFLSRAAAAACSPIKADKEISPLSHTLCFSLPSGLFSESTKILCILNILGVLRTIILPLQPLIQTAL
jgi:hypothetical protein